MYIIGIRIWQWHWHSHFPFVIFGYKAFPPTCKVSTYGGETDIKKGKFNSSQILIDLVKSVCFIICTLSLIRWLGNKLADIYLEASGFKVNLN